MTERERRASDRDREGMGERERDRENGIERERKKERREERVFGCYVNSV